MPARIVWSNLAKQDLLDHYVAIGAENPAAAERLYDRIEQRVGQLADHPRIGPRRPDIRPSARVLVEPPLLILYETYPDHDEGDISSVEIVRIVHGRRDLAALL
ncbi:plasmid stabilization protein [Methylobacterium sp. Leaf399]|uniref:type II toxin-antitoxin system RelE/ParE family toxin n=1 Tax=unclassified Methylobacterium TaxID=2615210 RepID=UPI0006FF935C|nr:MULTISPECIES: type II toxin-antitoxin system RelE/ParE family toxin [unclassified Methylobacterium]KQT16212.1 plasmid stabilization protein [Methylobacterium sp. Leaf399]KQT81844.1 plasmid stabilization protein [Methylobacterium sp. Leaf466]